MERNPGPREAEHPNGDNSIEPTPEASPKPQLMTNEVLRTRIDQHAADAKYHEEKADDIEGTGAGDSHGRHVEQWRHHEQMAKTYRAILNDREPDTSQEGEDQQQAA